MSTSWDQLQIGITFHYLNPQEKGDEGLYTVIYSDGKSIKILDDHLDANTKLRRIF